MPDVVDLCVHLAVVPLLLLFCLCGSAAGLPGGFTEMPFDTKSHLINYRTEGQGENTVMCLHRNMWFIVSAQYENMATEKEIIKRLYFLTWTLVLQQAVPLINMTAVDGDAVKICRAATTMASLPVFEGQKSVVSMGGMNDGMFQERFSSGRRGEAFGVMNQPSGSGLYSEYHGRESVAGDMFSGMALSDHFLGQYYNQVMTNLYFLSS